MIVLIWFFGISMLLSVMIIGACSMKRQRSRHRAVMEELRLKLMQISGQLRLSEEKVEMDEHLKKQLRRSGKEIGLQVEGLMRELFSLLNRHNLLT